MLEKILLNVTLLFMVIYLYKVTRHGLHILQLENYYVDRYWTWMNKHRSMVVSIKRIIAFAIPSICLIINNYVVNIIGFILELLVLLFLIIKNKKKQEKKPFVVTARIKRVYFTYFVLVLLACVLTKVLNYKVVLIILNIIMMFAYVLVYIVSVINKPVEKYIRYGFCKKAKKKLEDIPYLDVIGITGSYGKTSTKYIVNTILSQKYNTIMTPASYNTTMGVVRTINENVSSLHQLFICEMGAKYIGDIKEITDIVNPKYAILTAIGPQHLDTFKNIENVKRTKLEIVDALPEDGIAFVNWEDENIKSVKFTKKIIKYGLHDDANYYAQKIVSTERGTEFEVVIPNGKVIEIKTRLLGELNVLNIVAAVAVADTLGLSEEEIKIGARYIRAVPHRLELKQNANGSIVIDDAYNSNVKGANMALNVLKSFDTKQRILITPGIVELGDKEVEINQELGRRAASSADYVILVGAQQTIPIYNGLKDEKYPESKIYVAKNLQEALVQMNKVMKDNSVILLENDLPDNYL